MSKLAVSIYVHLLVFVGSIVATLWGLDPRVMWTILAFTVISAIMTVHADINKRCRKTVLRRVVDSDTRCILSEGHRRECVDFYGNRKEKE